MYSCSMQKAKAKAEVEVEAKASVINGEVQHTAATTCHNVLKYVLQSFSTTSTLANTAKLYIYILLVIW